jgi:regulator of protease activity HflC (stomatin/prohibitin superfamily)
MFMGPVVIVGILVVIAAIVAIANIRIVPQSFAYVMERLGTFSETWETGLHVKIPFVDRVAKQVSLKEKVADFAPQPVITKDNVTIRVDTIVFYQITDPKLYTYGVENPVMAIESLTATTLRNIIGDLELDATLTSRDTINAKMRAVLDEATDPWGIKVGRVELKSIEPPREIKDAMEKQMKAERLRREAILTAEGEKASKILTAEGEKAKQITEAQGHKEATILRAEAEKQMRIRQAEGEAEAILNVQRARAEAIRLINMANPGDGYLTLQSLETFAKAADGKATKIIIPSEIQSIAGLAKGLSEVIAKD